MRYSKIIITNVIFILIGIVILELIFGNWFKSNQMYKLNLVMNRCIKFDRRHLYQGQGNFAFYKRDKYGLRGKYTSPSSIDILTIGGSTTDQRYISEGYTWQDILKQEFRKKNKNVSVVNAGIDGQSSYGHIKDFDWWFPNIPGLRVKYYLFYIGINDFYVDQDYNDYKYDKFKNNQRSIIQIIRDNSVFFYLCQTIKNIIAANSVGHQAVNFSNLKWTDIGNVKNYNALIGWKVNKYRYHIKILINKIRDYGGIPIFATQATRHYRTVGGKLLGTAELTPYCKTKINGIDRYHIQDLFNDAVRDICKEENIILIDLANEVKWGDCDFYDFTHNTPGGAREIGIYLYQKLSTFF